MHAAKRFRSAPLPQSRDDLQEWLHEQLDLPADLQFVVFAAIDSVFTRHKQLWEASKEEAMQALSARFAAVSWLDPHSRRDVAEPSPPENVGYSSLRKIVC